MYFYIYLYIYVFIHICLYIHIISTIHMHLSLCHSKWITGHTGLGQRGNAFANASAVLSEGGQDRARMVGNVWLINGYGMG